MKKLSVIIPVFNENQTVATVVSKVTSASLPPNWEKEIIIVDDCSTDGTSEILSKLKGNHRLVVCAENGGKGAALKEGFKVATGDYMLIQDADLEYDPADYTALLKPIDEGRSRTVFGSRTMGKNRVPISRIFFYGGLLVTKIFNFFFRSRFTDIATCYKVFPGEYVSDMLGFPSDDFVFDVVELSHYLLRKGEIVEVPIHYESRNGEQGKKMSWRHGFRCLRRIISIFVAERITALWNIVKKFYRAYARFTSTRGYMPIFIAFSFFFLVFFLVYFHVSTLSSGDDHFFHFRFAQQMLQNGFFQSFWNFKSIYFSRMAQGNAYFMYYNFLFYVLAIPFALITPTYLGIKLYAVFFAAIAFVLLYWCLKKFEIKNPFLWTLVILSITSVGSIWRFFLSRPYALSPSLLLLLLYFLYKKNHIGVFAVSFVYLYWHSSTFFLPFCVVIGYYIIERFYRTEGDWKNLLSGFLGTVAAIAVTYFVSSGFLLFLWDTIINIYWQSILGKTVHIVEGTELYPLDFFSFIQSNAVIFAIFITALSVDIFSWVAYRFRNAPDTEYFSDAPKDRRYLHTTILILTAGFFLGTVAISARFGDYFTFFAAVYIALSFDYARRLIKISGSSMIRRSLGVGLGIVLIYLFTSNMLFLEQRLAYGQSVFEFYNVGSWLSSNSKPGSIVFEANWSWFPQLYYWSPTDYYSAGLEPRFMYDYSPQLYWLSVHIPQDGNLCDKESCPELNDQTRVALRTATSSKEYAKTMGDKIADIMLNQYKASYIVSSSNFRLFDYILSNNPHFKLEVYDSAFNNMLYSVHATTTDTVKK